MKDVISSVPVKSSVIAPPRYNEDYGARCEDMGDEGYSPVE